MFASSSSSLTRAATSTMYAQAQRNFSSSSSALASRRRQLIELLVDHERLGTKGDRVLVAPGYARHRLVPRRIARHVPFWKEYKILPFKQVPEMSDAPQIAGPAGAAPAPPPQPTPRELLQKLNDLPDSLTFFLRTTEADSTALHGSLTLADVSAKLEEYSVLPKEVEVAWADEGESGDRMKSVGTREVTLSVKGRGKEVYVLDIIVERLT